MASVVMEAFVSVCFTLYAFFKTPQIHVYLIHRFEDLFLDISIYIYDELFRCKIILAEGRLLR